MIQHYRQFISLNKPMTLVMGEGQPVSVTIHGDPADTFTRAIVNVTSALAGDGPFASLAGWVVGHAGPAEFYVFPGEGKSYLVVLPQQHIHVEVLIVEGAQDAKIEVVVNALGSRL